MYKYLLLRLILSLLLPLSLSLHVFNVCVCRQQLLLPISSLFLSMLSPPPFNPHSDSIAHVQLPSPYQLPPPIGRFLMSACEPVCCTFQRCTCMYECQSTLTHTLLFSHRVAVVFCVCVYTNTYICERDGGELF